MTRWPPAGRTGVGIWGYWGFAKIHRWLPPLDAAKAVFHAREDAPMALCLVGRSWRQ